MSPSTSSSSSKSLTSSSFSQCSVGGADLVPGPVEREVDVEGGGAGDGEHEVGEPGDGVHPDRPGVLLVRLQEGLGELPDGGDQSDGVTEDDDDHDVDTTFGDEDLAFPNQFLTIIENYYEIPPFFKKIISLLRDSYGQFIYEYQAMLSNGRESFKTINSD